MWRPPGPTSARRSLLVGLAMSAMALVTLLAWALAAAPGSAPDDNYHLSSIWCATGADEHCGDVPGDPTRMRPPNQVSGASCFSQDSDKSAACQNDFATDLEPGGAYQVGNWNGGQYPPLFYDTMHLFITGHLYSSVLLMRVVNSLILVGLLGLLVANMPRRLRPLAVVPIVVTAVPLGLSLMSSTNPSSWTIAGAAALWPALYASFEARGRQRLMLLAVFLLAVLLASGSRGDGALFSIVGIGLVMIVRFRRLLANPVVLGVALVGVAVAGAFFLTSGQSTVVSSGGFGGTPEKVLPWHQVAISNLQALPNLWVGSLGFGFMGSAGWLDTPFPALVGFSSTVVWAAVVFTSWREMFLEKVFAVSSIGAAMVVYPIVMLGLSGLFVGTGFQPRYLLPLLIVFTGVSMLSRGVAGPRFAMFQSVIAVGALSVAQAISLHTQIRRYVTGLDVGGLDLDRASEWWWGGPLTATTTWLLGSLAFTVLAWFLLRPAAFAVPEEPMEEAALVRDGTLTAAR